jgi:hypothetical protein
VAGAAVVSAAASARKIPILRSRIHKRPNNMRMIW